MIILSVGGVTGNTPNFLRTVHKGIMKMAFFGYGPVRGPLPGGEAEIDR
jgi:hypothetical protein